jgi:hypothetical protein
MNMLTVLDTSAQVLRYQLQQLQGLQIWELRKQTHQLASQYKNCTIHGPELIGDKFVTEITEGMKTCESEHALPHGYCDNW